MEEKLKALAENEEFTEKLKQTESMEEAIKLFAEYGVEVTEEDLKNLMAAVPEGELDEAALENVSGGFIGFVIAAAIILLVTAWKLKNAKNSRK